MRINSINSYAYQNRSNIKKNSISTAFTSAKNADIYVASVMRNERTQKLAEQFCNELKIGQNSAMYNDMKILNIIKDKNFDPNMKLSIGLTDESAIPVEHIIDKTNSLILFKELVSRPDFNPNVEAKPFAGFVADLIMNKNSKYLECLLNNNANVDLNLRRGMFNPNGYNAIELAQNNELKDCVKLLEFYANEGGREIARRNMMYTFTGPQNYHIDFPKDLA